MTARQMFEKLGYIQKPNYNVYIVYAAPHPWLEFHIVFDKIRKEYYTTMYNPKLKENEGYIFISMDLHAAIHQQMIELGWTEGE